MSEKVESGLGTDPRVTSEMHRIRKAVALVPPVADREDLITYAKEIVGLRAEVQLKHEAHRKTWRQLEQVTGLLPELRQVACDAGYYGLAARIDAALSQQAEPAPSGDQNMRDLLQSLDAPGGVFEPAPAQDGGGLSRQQLYAAALALICPAQTEQNPVYAIPCRKFSASTTDVPSCRSDCDCSAALSQQAEPAPARDGRENWNVALLQVAVVLEALLSHDREARLKNMDAGKVLAEAYAKLKDIRAATRPAQTAPQPEQVVAYRTLDRYGSPVTDWIDGEPAGGDPIVSGGSFQLAYGAPQPERWFAVCGDWHDTTIAIHGERSGYIACGIPEDKAHAIIKAHNIGLPGEGAALSATPSPAMDAKEE